MSLDALPGGLSVPTEILPRLQAAARTGEPHSLLLCVPDGCGAVDAARAVAAEFLGNNTKLVFSGAHPDCTEIYPQGASGEIKVDSVRAAVAQCFRAPALSDRRALLIPQAQLLGAAAAAALLKSLEEPPGNTLFVLCAASREQLLETVASRCAGFRLTPPTREFAKQLLCEKKLSLTEKEKNALLKVYGVRTEFMLAAAQNPASLNDALDALNLYDACMTGDRLAALVLLNRPRAELRALLLECTSCAENELAAGNLRAAKLLASLTELLGELEANMFIPTVCARFCAEC